VLKLNPEGKLGLTAKLIDPNPPDAVTGTILIVSLTLLNVADDITDVVFNGGGSFIVILNVLLAV
jgi:hypothetical protein